MRAFHTLVTRLLMAMALGLGSGALNSTLAHGPGEPEHGGVVTVSGELSFELAGEIDGAALYVVDVDHDQPISAADLSGKLTVLGDGRARVEADLRPAGENRLVAAGVKLSRGDKVVAVVTIPTKRVLTLHFVVE